MRLADAKRVAGQLHTRLRYAGLCTDRMAYLHPIRFSE